MVHFTLSAVIRDVENGTVLLDDMRRARPPQGWACWGTQSDAEFRTNGRQATMLEEIKRLFAELHIGGKHASHFDADDCRVASAALLVHVATLEHDLTGPARQTLARLLKSRFSLTDELTDELIAAAVAADREAVDFYHFTHLLISCLDEPGRLRLIEMLWEMAAADGSISEFEDNMMWRVADLLAVPPRDRIALRQRAAGREAGP
jgi:uncharacterized tellurite resistance protein B-like protein